MRKQCVPGISPPPSQTPGYEARMEPNYVCWLNNFTDTYQQCFELTI